MLSKIFKLVSIIIFFLYQNSLYSKTTADVDFNPKYLTNYLSALLAYDNQNNNKAIKYFNSSKNLIKKHDKFLKQYVFSLVLNGQIKDAIKQIKLSKNKNSANFFEAYVLLLVDSLQKQKFEKNITSKVFGILSAQNSIKSKKSIGATAPENVKQAIKIATQKYL